jgi:type I restriction/modification specificity protein
MKDANFLEKLLDNQPVEWKKLGEVCDIKTGKGVTKKDAVEDGVYPIISGGKTPMDYIDKYNRDANTVTVSRVGANAGYVNYLGEKFYLNDKCFSVIPKIDYIDSKFLYYILKAREQQITAMQSLGGVPTINTSKVGSIEIPIPPLSVQSRIVEILDKFTSLEAELEAELELRKKQYAYYREQLLNFSYTPPSEFNVVYKKLGEVAELVRGNGLSKKDFAPEGIPAIHYGQIYTYYGNETKGTISFVTPETASKLRKVFCGNVVITNTSENLEDVGKALLYSGESEAVTGGHATIIRCSEHLLPKYFVYYTMTYSFFDQKRKLAKGTKVIDVSATDLARIEIPLPPLSEQARIVEILDKFDTLTNSISEGLPLEIQLRRQQYEYYREQLLDFRRF